MSAALALRPARGPAALRVAGWLFALAAGAALAWIDTRPTWDDTGVEVALVFGAAFVAAALARAPFWAIALVVGGAIPLANLAAGHGAASAAALVPAGLGALAGSALARAIAPTR